MSSLLRLGEGRIIRLRVIQDTKVTPLPHWKSATMVGEMALRQRKWGIEIVCAQAGFDVCQRNFFEESSQRTGGAGCCVALDADDVGSLLLPSFSQFQHRASDKLGEALAGFHQIEIKVWLDSKKLENRSHHFAVLTG